MFCSHATDMPGHDPAYTFVADGYAYTFVAFVVHPVALTKKEKRGPTPSEIPVVRRP